MDIQFHILLFTASYVYFPWNISFENEGACEIRGISYMVQQLKDIIM
jgi:hypothetical protein